MVVNDNITKRAITYSVLAHISGSAKLAKGQLDVFIPIVKKCLHHISDCKAEIKGANISEIADQILLDWQIEIPIPVLRTILMQISKELKDNDDANSFVLNTDGSFWIKRFVFEDFDEQIKDSERNVKELQIAYQKFCKIFNVPTSDGKDVIRFIEQHKDTLAHYLSNSDCSDKTDYSLTAKFVDYFKQVKPLYEEIRDLYLGSTISCAIGYLFDNLKNDVTLLLDTNFIISLLDLNTPESTKTCSKLLQICKKSGYSFIILPETKDEIQSLLEYKSRCFDKVVLQKNVNKEDVFCACERRGLNSADLMRISDNIDSALSQFDIRILPNSTSLRNKAKFSKEYTTLKSYRNNDKAALHDAMAILYVREKRGKNIKSFEKVNCWFVNNSITHDFEHDAIENIINGNTADHQPEIIKADDLLNILWLSTPSIRTEVTSDEMVDIGLTTLVAHTLNKSLPKARIIRELDENIQKYKSSDITDRDVYLLSVRIANNQMKNIEELNSLAVSDVTEFNYRVKEEARKQAEIEAEQQKQLNNLFLDLSKAIQSVSKQSEAMSIEKKASDEQVSTLKNQLYKSEIDKNTLSKQIDKKDEKIKFQKNIIVGLIVLIVVILTITLFVFLPIKQYIKVIVASIGSLGGVWGFISMIINLVKLRR
ncbi:MAG: hypothetical protein K2J62_01640 [Bacteroidales bacterium]|nr:hypothetical protein [Bacteroidales bacterium]